MSRQPPEPCPRCGALNSADFRTCVRCGRPLDARATPNAAADPAARQGAQNAAGEAVGRAGAAPPWTLRGPLARRVSAWFDGRSLVATKALVALTVLVFAGQTFSSLQRGVDFNKAMFSSVGADAVRFGAFYAQAPRGHGTILDFFGSHGFVDASEALLRCFSAVYVHFGLLHLVLNMLALVQFARVAEPALGSARFLVVYVASGFGGFVASVSYSHLAGHRDLFTAGASGAVFGLVGLVLGLLVRRRDPRWKAWAVQAVLYLVVSNFLAQVNNVAHVGGLVVGALLGLLYGRDLRAAPRPVALALAFLSLVASLAALGIAQTSPLWPALAALAEQ